MRRLRATPFAATPPADSHLDCRAARTLIVAPQLHDWAYLELADLDAAEYDEQLSGLWPRGLLIRRNIADVELAFLTTW